MTIDTMTILVILGLLLNFITLIVVCAQTIFTRKALKVAINSVELAKTSRQVEMLPKMNFIIHVQYYLKKWSDEIEDVLKCSKSDNKDRMIDIFKKAPDSSSGLIDKWLFEKMPNWLSVIYETGAQYYYNSSCLFRHLRGKEEEKISHNFLKRFEESLNSLKILSKYIKDEIPEIFLNAPASLNTNDFFEKK